MNRRQIKTIIGGERRGESVAAIASRVKAPRKEVARVIELAKAETALRLEMRAKLLVASELTTFEQAKASAKRLADEGAKPKEPGEWRKTI